MSNRRIKIPVVPEKDLTPPVKELLAVVERLVVENSRLTELVQQLRDEIAVLKGEKAKPKITPSNLDKNSGKDDGKSQSNNGKDGTEGEDGQSDGSNGKRSGSAKRSKTGQLVIHAEERIVPNKPVPPGSRFKGYRDYVVQDIRIIPHNTLYRLECWQTPDGQWLTGQLPAFVQGSHFGPTLRGFVIYQYHQCHFWCFRGRMCLCIPTEVKRMFESTQKDARSVEEQEVIVERCVVTPSSA